eukprot:gene25839-28368_t
MFRRAVLTRLLPQFGAPLRNLAQGTAAPVKSMVEVSDGAMIAVTRYNQGSSGSSGDGTELPLLMINGWTCPASREVIVFDNRGIGNSSVTEGSYSV